MYALVKVGEVGSMCCGQIELDLDEEIVTIECLERLPSATELRAVSTNMAVIATYWLSFEYARDPRGTTENERIGRGVYQVMAMISPFLIDEARALLERLSVAYLKP